MNTKHLVPILFLAAACSGEDIYDSARVGGTGTFGTPSKIQAHLDGKTLTMNGTKIPSHPNGYDENVNFGDAKQCYHEVTMTPLGGRITVVSRLGTLENADDIGASGSCDRTRPAGELTFVSTAVLIENVVGNGECFDFTVTYPGFGQEGRGQLNEDGSEMTLELFFKDQAIGHRCGDGMVGDPTVMLRQESFTGDARQRYSIQ